MSNTVPAYVSVSGFQNLRTETYIDVASAALLIYDFGLTFPSEVKLMWPSKWNAIKILFILTRYLPFVDMSLILFYQTKTNISVQTCQQTYYPAGWLIVIGISIAEIILVVRTWAIWGRSKRIAIVLGVACLVAFIPVLVIENIFLNSIVFSPYPNPATPGCLLTAGDPIIALSFVILIIFETLVLILTLIKGVQHYRVAGNRGFVAVLYRDGILFYIYLFIISLVNLIVIVSAPRELADILAIFQRVLHSCLSARVLLNLREARHRETRLTSLNSTPLQHISFEATRNSAEMMQSIRRRWEGVVLDISGPKLEKGLGEKDEGEGIVEVEVENGMVNVILERREKDVEMRDIEGQSPPPPFSP